MIVRRALRLAKLPPSLLAGPWVVAVLLGCHAPALPDVPVDPGTYQVWMPERAGGYQRSYRIHVPPGVLARGGAPLLVALHGGGSDPRTLERRSGLNALAARQGFVVVYPRGEGGLGLFRHWNAGHCCATGQLQGRDDVGFVRRVIDDVARRLPVDAERVYLTGFSNGGMLAWRFAAEHPERVAGVAVVSATLAEGVAERSATAAEALGTRAAPLLLLYGRDDRWVPPRDVEASLAAWVRSGGCGAEQTTSWLREGRVERRVWPACRGAGRVEAWAIDRWGHRWPGPELMGQREDALAGFDAAETIWAFFTRGVRGPAGIGEVGTESRHHQEISRQIFDK